jgi:hypothetical protein
VSDYETAMREIVALFRTAWNANAAAIVGYVPEIRYVGVTGSDSPPPNKYYARLSYQQVANGQTGVGTPYAAGQSMYTASGLVFVQLFGPISDATVWAKLKSLAVVARKAYEGKKTASDVWFRNVKINELSPEDNWQRINVVADYSYDEISG